MTWKQKVIDDQYGGNAEQFETAFAEAVTEGNLQAVHWDDLIVDATTLTHVKNAGRELIKINLGYLPPNDVMMPYEPYLRALIQNYWNHSMAEDEFLEQLDDHLKLIRNADMKHNTCQTYDPAIINKYHKTFVPYGYAVRSRLANFLGYVPQLEHSLIAEMWMRDIMSDETYRLPDEIAPDDMRALTLIKYREVLLADGQQAADASPLLG
ncbi:hypothetical protein [Spirosoma linguale]|uniref:Uncharacterized protein n=1 Tax=Spirosoma linguale (strain ATCC 33905 / DSM 74 / LMG 10896 / Claus 1) TaxID=504472 RepID=D2QCJ7_SPILD|nr:hypothetical protein Slin_1957 [Spirosoma linguale DSM 74]